MATRKNCYVLLIIAALYLHSDQMEAFDVYEYCQMELGVAHKPYQHSHWRPKNGATFCSHHVFRELASPKSVRQ